MALAEAVAYGVAAVVMTAVFYVALELAAALVACASAGARGVGRWGREAVAITTRAPAPSVRGYVGPRGCSVRPRRGAPGAARPGA